jgi:NAD(P)H-hydrate epimerase
MKPAFTFDEIREIEKSIIDTDNIPSIILMENAGKNSCDVLLEQFPQISDYQICIICGKGNNAGDGYTLARHLIIKGYFVTIVQLVQPTELKGDALINYDILKKILPQTDKGEIVFSFALEFFEKRKLRKDKILLIDAILGTGIKGKLDDKFSKAISSINALRLQNKKMRVVSLDVPSGLISGEQINPVVNADMTISMGTYKTELLFGEGKENSGDLHVVPIGIDKGLIAKYDTYHRKIIEINDVRELFPKRKKTSFKYSNGKVLIIGGSKGLSGAAAMSSLSALKSGAGGVAAAIPDSIASIFSRKLFEIMTLVLDSTDEGTIAPNQFDKLKKRLEWADAVLIGPGISLNEQTKEFVFDVIAKCNKNLVVDADALTVLASGMNVLLNRKVRNEIILTPHLGEFSRLSGVDINEIRLNRFEVLKEFVKKYNVHVSLKSETTVNCTSSGEIFINSSGNQSLAVIGSGDVLSGIMVSILAQTGDVNKTMLCGNYLHGLCADIFSRKYGNKQTGSPQDMIKMIPKAVTELLT